MNSKCFLLATAKKLKSVSDISFTYDEIRDLNIVTSPEGERYPASLVHGIITGSKTESAPGDDDPDPDSALCY
tara:strand:+ start:1574 stop:1792 length:219 start_codon:yes stop_codon:yes gene_type:complete